MQRYYFFSKYANLFAFFCKKSAFSSIFLLLSSIHASTQPLFTCPRTLHPFAILFVIVPQPLISNTTRKQHENDSKKEHIHNQITNSSPRTIPVQFPCYSRTIKETRGGACRVCRCPRLLKKIPLPTIPPNLCKGAARSKEILRRILVCHSRQLEHRLLPILQLGWSCLEQHPSLLRNSRPSRSRPLTPTYSTHKQTPAGLSSPPPRIALFSACEGVPACKKGSFGCKQLMNNYMVINVNTQSHGY